MPDFEPTDARKEVHRAVGRNLLNFQRFELLLKYLLGRSAVSAEISDFEAAVERRKNKVGSQMLGLLAKQLFEEFLFSISAPPPETFPSKRKPPHPDKNFAMVSTITIGDQQHAEWKVRLEKLVKDRNWLVHQFLETFPPDTLDTQEGCQKALAALEQQRDRIRQEVDALKLLIDHFHEIRAALKESLQDPQFCRDLFGTESDQSRA